MSDGLDKAPHPKQRIAVVQSGWAKSDAAKIAHYFWHDGESACHMWTATVLDKPALRAPRCPACRDMIEWRS